MYKLEDASKLHHELSGKAIVDDKGNWLTTYEDYSDFPQDHKDFIDRELSCVNALQGIPTESLGEVKKAWLAWKLISKGWTGITMYRDFGLHIEGFHKGMSDDEYEEIETMSPDGVIASAIKCKEAGADFGELNALLDSVKEEM